MSAIEEFLLARIADDEAGTIGTADRKASSESQAKRRIVELHKITPPNSYLTFRNPVEVRWVDGLCGLCSADDEYRYVEPDGTEHPCDTLKALVLPYVDHPDCRLEWLS